MINMRAKDKERLEEIATRLSLAKDALASVQADWDRVCREIGGSVGIARASDSLLVERVFGKMKPHEPNSYKAVALALGENPGSVRQALYDLQRAKRVHHRGWNRWCVGTGT